MNMVPLETALKRYSHHQHCACKPRGRGVVVLVLLRIHTSPLVFLLTVALLHMQASSLLQTSEFPPGRAAYSIRAAPAHPASRLSQPGQRMQFTRHFRS